MIIAATAVEVASMRDMLSSVAGVSGTLLGISLALVAVVPTAAELVGARSGRLEAALRSPRMAMFTAALVLTSAIFAAVLLACCIGFLADWLWLGDTAVWLCIVGLVGFVTSCAGLLLHLRRAL